MEYPYHHLRKSIITWDGDLIEYKLPAPVSFNPTLIMAGDPSLLTKIVDFNIDMSANGHQSRSGTTTIQRCTCP